MKTAPFWLDTPKEVCSTYCSDWPFVDHSSLSLLIIFQILNALILAGLGSKTRVSVIGSHLPHRVELLLLPLCSILIDRSSEFLHVK